MLGIVDSLDATPLGAADSFSTQLVLRPDHSQDYVLLEASPHCGSGRISLGEGDVKIGEDVTCVVAIGD